MYWRWIVMQSVCQIIVQQIKIKHVKTVESLATFHSKVTNPASYFWCYPWLYHGTSILLAISSLNLPSIFIAMQMTPCSTCPSPKPRTYLHPPAHYPLSQPTGNQILVLLQLWLPHWQHIHLDKTWHKIWQLLSFFPSGEESGIHLWH